MRLARFLRSDDPDRPPIERRAVALVLTVIAHVGLLLLLLSLTPSRIFAPMAQGPQTLTVTLDQAEAQQQAPKAAAKAAPRAGAKAHEAPPTAPPPPVAPPPVPLPDQPKALPGVLFLSKAELDAADISRLPKGERQADAGGGAGSGAGDTPTAGTGRNGQPLYAAEWVREPTDAEIGGYLRRGPPARGAWAEIACQTVARNRVDDCEALADSPAGSGLANEMVEAAWQFLVRPPRVGGRTLVGTWVRIRISWSRGDGAG